MRPWPPAWRSSPFSQTASRSAAFRLLLVGLALLLVIRWVSLKWTVVSLPRQGDRIVLQAWFSLQRFLFLAAAVARSYGIVEASVTSHRRSVISYKLMANG
ncbi:MAG: hypothetical protein ACK4Z6_08725 [Candidatus Methylomirabilales bacterium]